MVATSAIRVLHVLGGLDRGGVETWLLHVLRHMDRQAFHMDFLVHQAGPVLTTMRSVRWEAGSIPVRNPIGRDSTPASSKRSCASTGRSILSIATSITIAATCCGWRIRRACRCRLAQP